MTNVVSLKHALDTRGAELAELLQLCPDDIDTATALRRVARAVDVANEVGLVGLWRIVPVDEANANFAAGFLESEHVTDEDWQNARNTFRWQLSIDPSTRTSNVGPYQTPRVGKTINEVRCVAFLVGNFYVQIFTANTRDRVEHFGHRSTLSMWGYPKINPDDENEKVRFHSELSSDDALSPNVCYYRVRAEGGSLRKLIYNDPYRRHQAKYADTYTDATRDLLAHALGDPYATTALMDQARTELPFAWGVSQQQIVEWAHVVEPEVPALAIERYVWPSIHRRWGGHVAVHSDIRTKKIVVEHADGTTYVLDTDPNVQSRPQLNVVDPLADELISKSPSASVAAFLSSATDENMHAALMDGPLRYFNNEQRAPLAEMERVLTDVIGGIKL